MGEYQRKATRWDLRKDKWKRRANLYQVRKRMGQWALTKGEKGRIAAAANYGEVVGPWRDPYGDSPANAQKPMATWRDARDAAQGRGVKESADFDNLVKGDLVHDAGEEDQGEEYPLPKADEQSESSRGSDHFHQGLFAQAQFAAQQKKADDQKQKAELAKAVSGVRTAAQARAVSKRLVNMRESQRVTQRQTASRMMFANLGATKGGGQQIPDLIIEEEEKEED